MCYININIGLRQTHDVMYSHVRLTQSNFNLSVISNLGLYWFCLAMFCDWSWKLMPPSKPIATWSFLLSRAWGSLRVFYRTLSFHWLLVILTLVLIGSCDYFQFIGFCLKWVALNWKVLYALITKLQGDVWQSRTFTMIWHATLSCYGIYYLLDWYVNYKMVRIVLYRDTMTRKKDDIFYEEPGLWCVTLLCVE